MRFILETNSIKDLIEDDILVTNGDDYFDNEDDSFVNRLVVLSTDDFIKGMIEDLTFTQEFNLTEFLKEIKFDPTNLENLRNFLMGMANNLSEFQKERVFGISNQKPSKEASAYFNDFQIDWKHFFDNYLEKMDFKNEKALFIFLAYIKDRSQCKSKEIYDAFLNKWKDDNSHAKLLNFLLDSDLAEFISSPERTTLNPELIQKIFDIENTYYGQKLWNQLVKFRNNNCISLFKCLAGVNITGSCDMFMEIVVDSIMQMIGNLQFGSSTEAFQEFVAKKYNLALRAMHRIFIDHGDDFLPMLLELGARTNKDLLKGILSHKSEKFAINYAVLACLRGVCDFDSWCTKRNLTSKKSINTILDAVEFSILGRYKKEASLFADFVGYHQLNLENLYKILQTCSKLNKKTPKPKQIQERITALSKDISNSFPEIDLAGGLTMEEYVKYIFERFFGNSMQVEDIVRILKRYQAHTREEIRKAFVSLIDETFNLVKNIKSTTLKAEDIDKLKLLVTKLINEKLVSQEKLTIFFKTMANCLKSKENTVPRTFAIDMLKNLINELHAWNDFTNKLFSMESLKENHLDLLEEIRGVIYECFLLTLLGSR